MHQRLHRQFFLQKGPGKNPILKKQPPSFALMVALVRFVFQPPLQASQRKLKTTVFFRVEVWVLWHLSTTQQEQ